MGSNGGGNLEGSLEEASCGLQLRRLWGSKYQERGASRQRELQGEGEGQIWGRIVGFCPCQMEALSTWGG